MLIKNNRWHPSCKIDAMIRIAVAQWQERVSPVFDVCSALLVIDIDNGHEVARKCAALHGDDPFARTAELTALGVQVLICGAISQMQETALVDAGIAVHGFIRGQTENVIGYFLQGNLFGEHCHMPGCARVRRRRGQGGRGRLRKT